MFCSPAGVGEERVLAPVCCVAVGVVTLLLGGILSCGEWMGCGLVVCCFCVAGGVRKSAIFYTSGEISNLVIQCIHVFKRSYCSYWFCSAIPVGLIWHGHRDHLFLAAVVIVVQVQRLSVEPLRWILLQSPS